ncbi:alanine racemase [Microbacterium album]|uniref:Alanine racemase C-terminal domain-containing protein n=1 Tax=Microbacterium album TaxID=2053191 RepID=A0A917IEB3_9MICO|nr:alanine racemase C-terminal domain-containing protein [Microbacterium album]GGH35329.1 hypothetical protein GCM10010921_03650 [Microbacterium album]
MDPTTLSTHGASAPLARVSRTALERNARRARERGTTAVDLRRDGWGHGADAVARAAAAVGLTHAVVDATSAAAAREAGLAPAPGADASGSNLDAALLFGFPGSGGTPVLSLTAPVLSVKELRAGEGVSYGYIHRAPADTRVALVAGGYAEGVVRALGSRVDVEIAGRLHPIVGRVAMDVCVVDLGDADVSRGATVTYFGAGLRRDAIAEWAAATGLSAAELVAAVGLHVRREVVE